MKHLWSKIVNYIVLQTFNDNKHETCTKIIFAALICTFLASTLVYKYDNGLRNDVRNVHHQLSDKLTKRRRHWRIAAAITALSR